MNKSRGFRVSYSKMSGEKKKKTERVAARQVWWTFTLSCAMRTRAYLCMYNQNTFSNALLRNSINKRRKYGKLSVLFASL